MKSAFILASAGAVVAQTITADVAAISSAVSVLNSQVSAFSVASQATAIVDTSEQIVSLINKGTSDAKSEGAISETEVTGLLEPFQNLQSIVSAAIGNLVSRKAVASSLTLGNVVEAQLGSQLTAASGLADAVQSNVGGAFKAIASSLAGAIISDISSGYAAFGGLSGPSTLGGSGSGSSSAASSSAVSSSASASASGSESTSSVAVSTSSSVVSSAVSGSSTAVSTTTAVVGSGGNMTGTSTGTTIPLGSSSATVVPSSGADQKVVGFFGIIAAAFIGMIAL